MLGLRRRHERELESRLVWIFGSPRSGSTWLLNLLAADPLTGKLDEPSIGAHLGMPIESLIGLSRPGPGGGRIVDARGDQADYFFSRQHSKAWAPPLRRLLLDRFGVAVRKWRLLVIKEPTGSEAADLLMSLLPRSRMIFLLRDGRDVVDSELDALQRDSWVMRQLPGYNPIASAERSEFICARAHVWRSRTEIVQRAYEAHPTELRELVRYEELLADPERVMTELCEWLDLDTAAVLTAVRATAFERLPDGSTGPGQFARAATPGLWRTNLTGDEQRLLEEILASKLGELGYD